MQDYRNITGYIWFYFDYILPYFSPFFTPKTLISQKLLIVHLKPFPLDSAHPKTGNAGLSSSFNAFFLLKIKKMLTEQNWDWYRKKTSVVTGQ